MQYNLGEPKGEDSSKLIQAVTLEAKFKAATEYSQHEVQIKQTGVTAYEGQLGLEVTLNNLKLLSNSPTPMLKVSNYFGDLMPRVPRRTRFPTSKWGLPIPMCF